MTNNVAGACDIFPQWMPIKHNEADATQGFSASASKWRKTGLMCLLKRKMCLCET